MAVQHLLFACAGAGRSGAADGAAHTAAVEPAAAPASQLAADYECSFSRDASKPSPVACAIRADRTGTLRFEQAAGAVRLSGAVTPDEAGFRLSGEIRCAGPRTGCPVPGTRDILFFVQRAGAYSAVVPLPDGQLLDIDLTRR